MSLADRLRSESAAVRVEPAPDLAGRIAAAVRAAGAPEPRAPIAFSWRPVLAAAAVLVLALGIAWAARPAPPAPAPLAAVPVPPALTAIVAAVPPAGPLHAELDAIGGDLAAAVRAVRGTVPF